MQEYLKQCQAHLIQLGCEVQNGENEFTVFIPELKNFGLAQLVLDNVFDHVMSYYPRLNTSHGPSQIRFYTS